MLKFRELKTKDVKIIDLKEGQVFVISGKKYAFKRILKGMKNMLVVSLENEKEYKAKIFDIFDNKEVVGKVTLKKEIEAEGKTPISIKDVKLNESVVIMTGRGNSIPQLYTLVEITKKAHSHVFKNPVTGKKEQFKGNDAWKVYRLNEILK